ncbi:MAG: formylglycine-generating enzyme family protein [Candidatus Poribacteria bacterium]
MNKRAKINPFPIAVAIAFFIVFGSITHSAKNSPPVVSNVHVEQRPGTEEAIITYDVDDADGDTLTISVQISDDGGRTFTVPAKTFSGDIGAGIRPGKNKRIIWDAGKDLTDELYNTAFRAKVIADDGKHTADEIIWPTDGAPMALIPAGEFQMGSYDGDNDEKPVHTVYLDAFYMDKYEVTVEQYRKFIQATGHSPPDWSKVYEYSPTDNHPIIFVSWEDAQAYCKWAGKRLPTEAEWEKAARGGLVGKKYPWGDSIDSGKANYGGNVGSTTPVGKYPPNGYGLYDMAGNVWEWCADWYDRNYYSSSPRENPPGAPSGRFRVCRGGAWNNNPSLMRVANRDRHAPTYSNVNQGFRCVVSSPSFLD